MTDIQPDRSAEVASGKRRVMHNTLFSAAQQVTTMTVALLLLPYMLWRLGAEVYGIYLTLQIFAIGGIVMLADLGFQGALVRYLVAHLTDGDEKGFRRLLLSGFLLFGLIGAILAGGLVAFGRFHFLDAFNIPAEYSDQALLCFYLYAGALLYGFPALALKAFLVAIQNFALLKSWEAGERLLFAAAVVVMLFFTTDLIAVVVLEQAIGIGMFLAFAVLSRRRYRHLFAVNPRYASRRSLQGVFGMSGYMFLNSASLLVYLKLPDIIIANVLGPVYLTYYSIIIRLPRAIKSLQGAINLAVTPFVAQLASMGGAAGEAARKTLVLRGIRLSYLLFMPIAVLVFVFAEEILTLWVGIRYAFLANLLRAFMLWQLGAIIVSFAGSTLTRTADFRRVVWPNLAVNIAFIGLLVWWVERFGLDGALAALLVSGVATTAINLRGIAIANGFDYREFYDWVVRTPILLAGLAGVILLGSSKLIWLEFGIGPALAVAIIALPGYLLLYYFILIDVAERNLITRVSQRVWQRPQ